MFKTLKESVILLIKWYFILIYELCFGFSKSYVDNFILIKTYTFYVYMGRLEISFNNFILYKTYK